MRKLPEIVIFVHIVVLWGFSAAQKSGGSQPAHVIVIGWISQPKMPTPDNHFQRRILTIMSSPNKTLSQNLLMPEYFYLPPLLITTPRLASSADVGSPDASVRETKERNLEILKESFLVESISCILRYLTPGADLLG